MKLTMTSTERVVTINDVPARIWEGTTETGVPVTAFITRIAVPETASDAEHDRFRAELEEHAPPSVEAQWWPARMILD